MYCHNHRRNLHLQLCWCGLTGAVSWNRRYHNHRSQCHRYISCRCRSVRTDPPPLSSTRRALPEQARDLRCRWWSPRPCPQPVYPVNRGRWRVYFHSIPEPAPNIPALAVSRASRSRNGSQSAGDAGMVWWYRRRNRTRSTRSLRVLLFRCSRWTSSDGYWFDF